MGLVSPILESVLVGIIVAGPKWWLVIHGPQHIYIDLVKLIPILGVIRSKSQKWDNFDRGAENKNLKESAVRTRVIQAFGNSACFQILILGTSSEVIQFLRF